MEDDDDMLTSIDYGKSKNLILRAPLSDFRTANDPSCYAKHEVQDVYGYNWVLDVIEIIDHKNMECLQFRLKAESMYDYEDADKLNVRWCLKFSDRLVHDSNQSYKGGLSVLGTFNKAEMNCNGVSINLTLSPLVIHGFRCDSYAPMNYRDFHTRDAKLSIGGTVFQAMRTTLTRFDGMLKLYILLEDYVNSERDSTGCIFHDRGPEHYRLILNYMRDGELKLPDSDEEVREILKEAEYLKMPSLKNLCTEHLLSLKSPTMSEIISLNIGGTIFQTTKATLTRFDGMFKTMLENDILVKPAGSNAIFIDRSPKHFDLILNYMRDGDAEIPESLIEIREILREAQYYLLGGLVDVCKSFFN